MVKERNQFYIQYQGILPPNALGYRLKLLSQAIDRRFQAILDPFGLTPLQWGILCCLWQDDGLPTLQLSKKLQQLSGNIAAALPTLEKQAYIRRDRDQADRRILRVWLTPEGKQLQQVLPQKAQALDTRLFASLSQEERDCFSALVDRLRCDLEDSHTAGSTFQKIDQA